METQREADRQRHRQIGGDTERQIDGDTERDRETRRRKKHIRFELMISGPKRSIGIVSAIWTTTDRERQELKQCRSKLKPITAEKLSKFINFYVVFLSHFHSASWQPKEHTLRRTEAD